MLKSKNVKDARKIVKEVFAVRIKVGCGSEL
jgi:hypothetical protein